MTSVQSIACSRFLSSNVTDPCGGHPKCNAVGCNLDNDACSTDATTTMSATVTSGDTLILAEAGTAASLGGVEVGDFYLCINPYDNLDFIVDATNTFHVAYINIYPLTTTFTVKPGVNNIMYQSWVMIAMTVTNVKYYLYRSNSRIGLYSSYYYKWIPSSSDVIDSDGVVSERCRFEILNGASPVQTGATVPVKFGDPIALWGYYSGDHNFFTPGTSSAGLLGFTGRYGVSSEYKNDEGDEVIIPYITDNYTSYFPQVSYVPPGVKVTTSIGSSTVDGKDTLQFAFPPNGQGSSFPNFADAFLYSSTNKSFNYSILYFQVLDSNQCIKFDRYQNEYCCYPSTDGTCSGCMPISQLIAKGLKCSGTVYQGDSTCGGACKSYVKCSNGICVPALCDDPDAGPQGSCTSSNCKRGGGTQPTPRYACHGGTCGPAQPGDTTLYQDKNCGGVCQNTYGCINGQCSVVSDPSTFTGKMYPGDPQCTENRIPQCTYKPLPYYQCINGECSLVPDQSNPPKGSTTDPTCGNPCETREPVRWGDTVTLRAVTEAQGTGFLYVPQTGSCSYYTPSEQTLIVVDTASQFKAPVTDKRALWTFGANGWTDGTPVVLGEFGTEYVNGVGLSSPLVPTACGTGYNYLSPLISGGAYRNVGLSSNPYYTRPTYLGLYRVNTSDYPSCSTADNTLKYGDYIMLYDAFVFEKFLLEQTGDGKGGLRWYPRNIDNPNTDATQYNVFQILNSTGTVNYCQKYTPPPSSTPPPSTDKRKVLNFLESDAFGKVPWFVVILVGIFLLFIVLFFLMRRRESRNINLSR